MATVLIVAGLVVLFAGAAWMFLPVREPAEAHGVIGDVGKVLEELNKMLDKFDKRYRPGVILMVVGLVLVSLGVFIETRQTKDAVKAGPAIVGLA
ncbi:hypothetical protein [Streptomyces lavendulocolor]|uniref:hypothetical protein n=1 Tax=Streptomyces lavendulocolor TaxID=67316 RepID=UPI0033F45F65